MNEEEANALDASQQRHNTSVKRRIEKRNELTKQQKGKKAKHITLFQVEQDLALRIITLWIVRLI